MLIDPKFYAMANFVREALPPEHLEDDGMNLPKIGAIVAHAGDGEHLDIGTGFGGSAIMAALVKIDMGHKGNIWCVDPYAPPPNSPVSSLSADMKLFNENAIKLNVANRIVLTPQPSYPFPDSLKNKEFVSAYLDGDKSGMNPWLDFLSVRGIVQKYLAFAGFQEFYPGVMVGVLRSLSVGGWILHYKDGNFLSMRRPIDMTDWLKLPDEEKMKRRAAMLV